MLFFTEDFAFKEGAIFKAACLLNDDALLERFGYLWDVVEVYFKLSDEVCMLCLCSKF